METMETYATLADLKSFEISPATIKPGSVVAIIGDNDELAQRVLLDLCWALRDQHRFAKVFSRRFQTTEFYKSIVPTPFIYHGKNLQEKDAKNEFTRWFLYHRKQYAIHGRKVSTFLFLDEVITDGNKNNKETAMYDQFFDVKDIGITTIVRAKDGIAGIPSMLKKMVDYTFILNNSPDIQKLQKQYAYMMFGKPHVFAGLIASCHPLQCLVIEKEPQSIDTTCILPWMNHIKRFECGERRDSGEVRLCSSKLWNFALRPADTPPDNDLLMYSRLLQNCAQTTGKKFALRRLT